MKKQIKSIFLDIGTVFVGSLLFAVSVNMFILPGNIILGGATGVATTLNILFNLPVGLLILVINIPLIIINSTIYGMKFFYKTIAGIAATSIAIDIFTFFPITITDPMLCALFGGISMGAGAGLLFSRGYTTGGTDLIAWIVKSKNKRLSTGKIIMIADFFIIVVLSAVLGKYINIIYSIIASYSFSTVADIITDGYAKAKTVFIISEKYKEISNEIANKLKRGVTVLQGVGWYTDSKKQIIVCVVKPNEIYKIKAIISSVDKNAFAFLNDTTEVIGYGFEAKK